MTVHRITPTLAAALQSMTESQLQSQTSRSAALDAGAVGLMGVDAAVAAVVLGVRSADHLWVAALVLLGVSLTVAALALVMSGADDIGPMAAEIIAGREGRTDDDVERELLEDLAARVAANQCALERKEPRVVAALASMLIAVLIALAGQLR